MTKLVTAASLIAASLLALLAAIFVNTADRYFPLGSDATVLISLEDSPAPRTQVLQELTEWSARTEVSLFLQAPADEDPNARTFYTIGPDSSDGVTGQKPFLPWQHTEFLSASELGDHNLAASYVPVGANMAERQSFTDVVESLGGQAWWTAFDWRHMLLQSLVESGAALALLTSGVLLVTSVLMWVLSRARRHDLQFLAGESTTEILKEDASVLVRWVVVPIALLSVISIFAVFVVSGLQYASRFMVPLLIGQMLLIFLALLTWAFAVALSWPTRQAIARRELPGAGFGLPSEALRLLSVAITALALPFLVAGLIGTQHAADQAQEWSHLDGWVSIRSLSAAEELEEPTREAAIDLSSKEQLAFSKALNVYSGPNEPGAGEPTLSLIVTDQAFLELMGIGPVGGPDWIPARETELSAEAAEIMRDSLPLWLADSAGLDAPDVHFVRWQGSKPLAAIDGATGELEFYRDPVVLVVENAGEALTGNLLLSSISTGNVIFGNTDAVRQAFDRHGAGDVILSVDRAADAGMLRAQLLNQTMWLRWLSLGLVLAALALSTAVGAEVWAGRLSRRIFVLRTTGYSWAWIARRRLLWECVSAAFISVFGVLFLVQLGLSPWWVLLLPMLYLPLSMQLHVRALRRRFTSLISRGP
ncbi:hypothetical protein GcLGCM259_2953 [Glutamicibacter creatinolyticus]|uniref:Uncharacterized protein n=1 Tax=Glutamicibacter creatinolyticus TaxID=162496 RepID=A0A5B7WXJ3_9MICC|nr:hypothetical protein [Glutamicibacter creatinolyticus]QCY48659.1 hypothetical protein GcLGCM259_2953 [Glutamicibacter creatinolyticus]